MLSSWNDGRALGDFPWSRPGARRTAGASSRHRTGTAAYSDSFALTDLCAKYAIIAAPTISASSRDQ